MPYDALTAVHQQLVDSIAPRLNRMNEPAKNARAETIQFHSFADSHRDANE